MRDKGNRYVNVVYLANRVQCYEKGGEKNYSAYFIHDSKVYTKVVLSFQIELFEILLVFDELWWSIISGQLPKIIINSFLCKFYFIIFLFFFVVFSMYASIVGSWRSCKSEKFKWMVTIGRSNQLWRSSNKWVHSIDWFSINLSTTATINRCLFLFTVCSLLKKLKQQAKEQIEERRPNLVKALKQMGDFYMELKWDFQSWGKLVHLFFF